MKHLVKNILILDKKSSFYQKKLDFLVSDGRIVDIAKNINLPKNATLISGKKLALSPAFVDLYVTSGEPSYTESETLASLQKAATHGGYSHICHQPTTQTVIEDKAMIAYLQSVNQNSGSQVKPLGGLLTRGAQSKMSEMLDMYHAGALAFSSGIDQHIPLEVFSNILRYAKGFDAKIMIHPEKRNLSNHGQVNQGKMSLMLGYKGIPQEAESIAVQEIIDIAFYQDKPVCILNVTTTESIDRIRRANRRKKIITSATSSLHVFFSEMDQKEYDTNLKLTPPLRSERDVKRLRKALIDGDIDMVYSQHIPRTTEEKILEFDMAEVGAINLQTSFLALLNALGLDQLERCIELSSTNPAKFLGIDIPAFEKGEFASHTILDIGSKSNFDTEDNCSKSKNSPFLGRQFDGSIVGLISNQTQSFFNL